MYSIKTWGKTSSTLQPRVLRTSRRAFSRIILKQPADCADDLLNDTNLYVKVQETFCYLLSRGEGTKGLSEIVTARR